jgi:hypothetical protein
MGKMQVFFKKSLYVIVSGDFMSLRYDLIPEL